MTLKNANAKTWALPARSNARRYSDPANEPASAAVTLASPTMTSDGASVAFSGGAYTTLIPQWSTDQTNWNSLSNDTTTPFTFTGVTAGSALRYFRALSDGTVASNVVSGYLTPTVPTVTASRINDTTIRFTLSGGINAATWTAYYRTPAGSGTYTSASLTVGQAYYDVTVSSQSTADFYIVAANTGGNTQSSVVTGSAAPVSNSTFPHAAALFADGFESQALFNVTGRNWSPVTNSTGFTWGSTNFTSLVTSTARVFGAAGVINDTAVTDDWTPFAGTTSLRFNYNAGSNQAEQRFFIGQHLSDCWIRYWIRVPTNFYHGTLNNKFLATWTNVYDGAGDVTFQTRPTSSGSCKLVVQDGGVAQAEDDAYINFISTPSDRGRWMQVCFRLVAASASGANNGVIQVWRRWSNESTWTQLYSKTNARFYEGGQGTHEGYLMGWANDPYTAQTEWLLDNFEISNQSMVV